MGAAREEFLRRSMLAGVASGVVISLTALTAGVTPAVAEPGAVETTTVQAPPQESAPSRGSESGGRQGRSGQDEGGRDEAPKPAAEVPAAPPQTQAPAPEPAPVQTQAPAPKPEPEPEPAPAPEPAPQVEAPAPTTQRPSTRVTNSPTAPAVEPPAETSAAPSTAEEPQPVERQTTTTRTTTRTTTARTTEAEAAGEETTEPSRAEDPAQSEGPEGKASETETSGTKASGTEASGTKAPESEESKAPESETDDAPESAEATEVEPVARVIETLKPQVLDAPVEDVVLAGNSRPVEVNPEPAKVEELAQLSSLIGLSKEEDRLREERRELREDQRQLREDQRQLREDQRELRAEQRDWDRRVRQWSPDWVQYDEFYRPMIVNPYRDPVRIVYEYENRPRVVTIPPLQRMVMYVADLAAYSFTAVVLNTVNTVVSTAVGVAVGSFFGGGFIPNIANIGNFAPPPPPPLWRYDDVPVQVRYSDAVYEPFRVQRIVDVGDDARYGERRVLLDGVTPVWGVWKQNAGGERQFEVHRTQQYPGLDTPREAPLPGDYRLRLASEEAPSKDRTQTYLITAGIACAVLSLGAVGAAGLLGRRRQI